MTYVGLSLGVRIAKNFKGGLKHSMATEISCNWQLPGLPTPEALNPQPRASDDETTNPGVIQGRWLRVLGAGSKEISGG